MFALGLVWSAKAGCEPKDPLPENYPYAAMNSPAVKDFNLSGEHFSRVSGATSGFFNVTDRGEFIPLTISSWQSETDYLCVGMFNLSDQGKLLWLYTNVNNRPPSLKEPTAFEPYLRFRRYGGQAVSIRTDYQIAHDLKAGYFGPVPNPNGSPSLYSIVAYGLKDKSGANMEEDALCDCQRSGLKQQLVFQATFSTVLIATVLLLVAM